MEQKRYKYEIILNLLNGSNHLRQIAKELNINHMTIKRALEALVKENVLDVKVQGKNNIYSIKKTLEAKNNVFISEIYKFNKFLNEHPKLKKDIIELKKLPVKLILIFGSYAKCNEKEDSDIDIYIETLDNNIKERASNINKKFSIKIGRYDKNNLLIKEIEKNHIILNGLEIFYEKNKFFD